MSTAMDDSTPVEGASRPTISTRGVVLARAIMAGFAFVLTIVALYLGFWVLVDGLGITSSRAPLAIPIVLGFGATLMVNPTLPSRAALLDGTARVPLAELQTYLRKEILAALVGVGVAVSVFSLQRGALVPMRSEVRDVQLDGAGNATIAVERKLEDAPPLRNGVLLSLVVVAMGTAFAAMRGAHRAWQLRDVVRGMGEE